MTPGTELLTKSEPRRSSWRAMLREPWTARNWRAFAHVMVGFPLAIVAFVMVLVFAPIGIVLGIVLGIFPLLVIFLALNWGFGALQRARFATILGESIQPPIDPGAELGWFKAMFARLKSEVTWRIFSYHMVTLFTATFGFAFVLAFWSVGIQLTAGLVVMYLVRTPGDNPVRELFLDYPILNVASLVVGLLFWHLAPWVTRAATTIDLACAKALLGETRSEALQRRVELLNHSRVAAVDAADAERRRIERDLHDGAQQRLVSLAMNLGMAKAQLGDPEQTKANLERAHEEAKQAMVELRDLVRGLHPAVLNDRGLDAALSGIAASSPIPVALQVRLAKRPSPTVEAVAYFVVAEALTNVTKHAVATQVRATVITDDEVLRLAITDNGIGGADASQGSGLRGLADRVASVGGTFTIDSPIGGPTTIMVELPCES